MSSDARLKGHDGEADRRRGRPDQDQADARAAPDCAAEIEEDEDLGDHAGGPEIADDRIREADGAPVDAGEGIQRAMAALGQPPRRSARSRGSSTASGIRCPSWAQSSAAWLGNLVRNRDERRDDAQDRDERQGDDHHIRPEGPDQIAADDVGDEEGHRAGAPDPAVVQAGMPLDRIGGDEVVARDDAGLRNGDEGDEGDDRDAAVGEQEAAESRSAGPDGSPGAAAAPRTSGPRGSGAARSPGCAR